ncbi:hypothetical protein [Plantactinospora sp. GCM10030261]|uniref:hypothetical protein n=1 Tax=Plantactinospora sp. GCM10030261 TaxID=3273420 RepID=UPI00361F5D03
MKQGARYALILGTGYLLGRRKRLRTALVLGGAVAAGRLSGNAGGLLRSLGGAADVGRLGDLRGPLVQAGRAAAVSAVNSRIDAVSDRLHSRAEALRTRAADRDGADRDGADLDRDTPDGAERDARNSAETRAPGNRDHQPASDSGDHGDEPADDGFDDEPYQKEPAPRRRRPAPGPDPTNAPVRRRGR